MKRERFPFRLHFSDILTAGKKFLDWERGLPTFNRQTATNTPLATSVPAGHVKNLSSMGPWTKPSLIRNSRAMGPCYLSNQPRF